MSLEWARALVLAAWGYLAIGVLFALAFLALGIRRVEPKARGASGFFYLLIFPGCMALWPQTRSPAMTGEQRAWHLALWLAILPVALALLALALGYRQELARQPAPAAGPGQYAPTVKAPIEAPSRAVSP